MRLISFLALSSLAILGCRSDSTKNPDGNTGDGTGSNGGAVKIQDVQNDAMAPGTPVALSGVIVTAIDNFGAKTGDIWVEEPEGGAFSGIHIFGAPATAVAALAVGDTVDVSGAVKDEFALTSDTTGRTVTELKPASGGMITLTKTGSGQVPAPTVVDALMIGQIAGADDVPPSAAFSAEWEKWEGVLITVHGVSALSAPKAFGSTMAADAFNFGITGVAKVEGSLTDITMANISRTSCMDVTGVVDYFFDYLILPRQGSDFDTTGTGCPTAETLCGDSIDNDGNGFNDCSDNNCVLTASATGGNPACKAADATISAIDMAADTNPAMPTFPMGNVEIDGVFVSAIAGNNFWVTASATASANSGLYVFGGGQPIPSGMVVGSKVNLIGSIQAFKSLSSSTEVLPEVSLLQATVVTGTGTIAASTQLPATLNTTATGRPWVGSLVTIAGKNKVTVAQTASNHQTGTLVNGATSYEYLGQIVPDANPVNTCYGDITGIWTWDGFNNKYTLVPTSIPTTTTGCP